MEQRVTFNGHTYAIVMFDENKAVTKITFPDIPADYPSTGEPFSIEYDPAGTIANVYDAYALLVKLGLIGPPAPSELPR